MASEPWWGFTWYERSNCYRLYRDDITDGPVAKLWIESGQYKALIGHCEIESFVANRSLSSVFEAIMAICSVKAHGLTSVTKEPPSLEGWVLLKEETVATPKKR